MKYILQKRSGLAEVAPEIGPKPGLQSLKRVSSKVSFIGYLLLFISRSSSLRLLFLSWLRRAGREQQWYRRGQTR